MAELLVQNGKSIEAIQEIAKDGDIVYVEPGEYDEVISLIKPGITYISLEKRKAKTGQWFYEIGASRIKVIDFEVTTGNLRGGFILNRGNKNNLIKGCHMFECGDIGVDVTAGSDYNIIEESLIHDCHYAFHTSGGGCIGNIFQRNHCYNHSDGINISPSAFGTKLIENIIHNCEDDGIHCFDDGKAEIIGNLVYNCKGVALWSHGNGGIVTKNNTIIGISGAKWGYVVWIEYSNHIFKNNIIFVDAADMKMLTGGGTGFIDYNNWWNVKTQVSKIGINDIIADPKFVDILNNDYRLKVDSPCKNAGDDGKDMGCYIIQEEEDMRDVIGINFTAVAKVGSISGNVKRQDGTNLSGIAIELTGAVTAQVITNADGNYEFLDLIDGNYTVTPKSDDYDFNPISINVVIPA